MSQLEFAYTYLKTIERKHQGFFNLNHLDIMDCLRFKGVELETVKPKFEQLPTDIQHEIETMFWFV